MIEHDTIGEKEVKVTSRWISYVLSVYHTIYMRSFLLSDGQNHNDRNADAPYLYYGDKIERGKNSLIILSGVLKNEKILDFKGITLDGIPIYHYKELHQNDECPYVVLMRYDDGEVAAVYDERLNCIILGADILKTSFLLLSRKEEKNAQLDEYQRFLVEQSIFKKIEYPIVNEYFYVLSVLHSIITERMMNNAKITKNVGETPADTLRIDKYAEYARINSVTWPENAPYAVCLTHDVDVIYKWWLKKAASYMVKGKWMDFFTSVGKGEYNNIEKIMDLESKFGYKSTFFFLTIKRDRMPRYNVKRLRHTIHSLIIGGWEVGLHGSPKASRSLNRLIKERNILENVAHHQISGVRNHYLTYTYPTTWEIQCKAGFKYDSTMGYSKKIGFRTGICHPHYIYLPTNDKKQNIIEFPMTLMDRTLEDEVKKIKKIGRKEAMMIKINNILQIVRLHKGLFVINWHQSSFDKKDYPELYSLYIWMLKRFKADGAFVGPCYRIYLWWKSISDKKHPESEQRKTIKGRYGIDGRW